MLMLTGLNSKEDVLRSKDDDDPRTSVRTLDGGYAPTSRMLCTP